MAATTGMPRVSMRRSEFLMAVPTSKASWALEGPTLIMSLRSPPAKKVFLAEV